MSDDRACFLTGCSARPLFESYEGFLSLGFSAQPLFESYEGFLSLGCSAQQLIESYASVQR